MIPQCLHFIWIWFAKGNQQDQYPKRYEPYLQSWKKEHPEWMIHVWNESEIETLIKDHFKEDIWKAYNAFLYPIQKVDLARICILFHQGGWYVDMDLKCNHSFSSLSSYDMVLCFDGLSYSNALMGSSKKHPLMKMYLKSMTLVSNKHIWEPKGLYVLRTTGPIQLTRNVFKWRFSNSRNIDQSLFVCTPKLVSSGKKNTGQYAHHVLAGEW